MDLRKKLLTRRKFIGLCAAGVGGIGYMRFGEARWLEVNQSTVNIAAAPTKEVKILHLSDFHASPTVDLDYIRDAVELGASLKPDAVCLTGDFITRKYDHFAGYAKVLKKLSDVAPTFACIGNHDGGRWIRRWGYADWNFVGNMLRDAEVTVLHNAARAIEVNGARLQFVGVGDLWAQELNAPKAFAETDKELRTVLLSHNPDSKTIVADFAWDLMLCGHTHGGQLKLPIIGTPFAPVVDKRYVAGLKPWRDRWIHVTKGVGNLHGMRFNCRPEVSLLKVQL